MESHTTYEEIASSYLNGNRRWATKELLNRTNRDLDLLREAFEDYYTIEDYYRFLESCIVINY
jgi:hypothetical protein